MEEWKTSPFEKYEVSTHGNIRNKKTQRMLKQQINGGYCHVHLMKDGKAYYRQVHRIVAETFIENPLNKETVNHKDGNKTNNHVENLEWCTHKENIHHAIFVLGIDTRSGLEKTHEKHKRKVRRSDGKIYNSIDEAKADINRPHAHIVEVCQGKLRKTAGYGWEYLEQRGRSR